MQTLRHRIANLSRLDRVVAATLVAVAAVIGTTVVLGDNVGVRVERFSPDGTGTQTSWISVQFSEEMEPEGVESRFRIEPPVPGEFEWSARRMVFRPAERFSPGQAYTVRIDSGAVSVDGREMMRDLRFSFTVRGAQVAHFAADAGGVRQVWLTDPARPGNSHQLTFAASDVLDYALSPDGRLLVYSEEEPESGVRNLQLLDIGAGTVSPLTAFTDSQATEPAFSPDGMKVAYTRVDFNTGVPGVDVGGNIGFSIPRVWVVDLSTSPMTNERLLPDFAGSSFAAKWSPDGRYVTAGTDPLVSGGVRQITVVDMESGEVFDIDSTYSDSASFSQDGRSILFIANTSLQFGAPTQLGRADLETRSVEQVPAGDGGWPVRDTELAWRPGSDWVAVARNGADGVQTHGSQAYLVNFVTGEVRPAALSLQHDIESLTWSPSGDRLAIGRIHRWTEDGSPRSDARREIVIYDFATGGLTTLRDSAWAPAWAP